MNQSKLKFLFLLWLVVLGSLTLFQNNTSVQDQAKAHNELCQNSFETNESKISQLSSTQSELIIHWPREAQDIGGLILNIKEKMNTTNMALLQSCAIKNLGTETTPNTAQLFALGELVKLTNTETNTNWKSYVKVVESTLTQLKQGAN